MQKFVDKVNQIGYNNFELLDITPEDIELFASTLAEIKSLVVDYPNSYTRKQVSQEIVDKIVPTQFFLEFLTHKLAVVKNHFSNKDRMENCDIALNLIVRLANNNAQHYILKKFPLSEKVTLTISRHGEKETINATGYAWVIGEQDVISSIKEKTYSSGEFRQILTNIAKSGHPIVVTSTQCFGGDIYPQYYDVRLEYRQIRASGEYKCIMCYLKDDSLMDAICTFQAWTRQNGADLARLDEDKLFELMQNI